MTIKSLIKSAMVVVRSKNGYQAKALKEICLIGKYESISVTNLDLNCFNRKNVMILTTMTFDRNVTVVKFVTTIFSLKQCRGPPRSLDLKHPPSLHDLDRHHVLSSVLQIGKIREMVSQLVPAIL
eukprot:sb/3475641/